MIQVAAAIIRHNGRVLICKRGPGGPCAFLWEFPGGKTEPEETPEQCVVRECREELEIAIAVDEVFADYKYYYPDQEINFPFFAARTSGSEVKLNVHTDCKWVLPDELSKYAFCPADVAVVRKLSDSICCTRNFEGE